MLLLQLHLSLETGPHLLLRLYKLFLQSRDQLLIVLVMLFLGAITADQGLGQHLNLLNHRLLL